MGPGRKPQPTHPRGEHWASVWHPGLGREAVGWISGHFLNFLEPLQASPSFCCLSDGSLQAYVSL